LTITSNFADGMSFDPNEITLVQGKIDAMCLACWGPEAEGIGTEAWAYREHYALQHLEVGASLLRALQHEQRSADECYLAVDSASLVFAIFHLWVQGCRASNEAVAYLEDRQLAFHALARNVFVAVTENDLPPSQASLQQIPLDTSVVALTASVLKKARKKFPLPKEEEAWLRATGKFLAPSSPKE